MALSWEDWFKCVFLPGRLYYQRKLESESRKGEPEIRFLPDLLRHRDGTAIDVGANRGIYSFLLSGLFHRVVAFEPNPDMVTFGRRMLPSNVEVRPYALGAADAKGQLKIPAGRGGRESPLVATLSSASAAVSGQVKRTIPVDVRTLDGLELGPVGFMKIDVEGTEIEVLNGARRTIARDRPVLMVELLAGFYAQPIAVIDRVCSEHGYRCQLLTEAGLVDAIAHLAAGMPTSSRNVLFFPKQ